MPAMNDSKNDANRRDWAIAGQKILVVDDDQDFAASMAESLEIFGYRVTVAHTVESALAIADEFRPDGVTLDLRLGTAAGLNLLPILRERFPDLVCVIVTGYPDVETAVGAIRHRADDYFRKPLLPEDVCKVLKRCFARIQAKRRSVDGKVRENLFGRLLVRRFSPLFIENENGSSSKEAISRRILPGFFVAVDMMLGPELVEQYQVRCQDIINRLSGGDRTRISWDDYYADPEAKKLVLDAQIKMALHFRELDKRIVWLTTLINNHVGMTPDMPSALAVTPRDTTVLLSFLFKDLSDWLSVEKGREEVFRQYGSDVFMRLAGVANRFVRESFH